MRNEYTFPQVRDALKEFAIDILANTANMFGKEYKGKLIVTAYEGDLTKLETEIFEFRFYAHHASVTFGLLHLEKLKNLITFDIEHKVYADSPHSTKISFYATEKDEEKTKQQILEFLKELMGDVKPDRRFSLKNFTPNRQVKPKSEEEIVEKALA